MLGGERNRRESPKFRYVHHRVCERVVIGVILDCVYCVSKTTCVVSLSSVFPQGTSDGVLVVILVAEEYLVKEIL